ncbi:MAG: formate--tetrahydrofolate ligase [Myxococcales bacterium]|nr:formate--tetrahydrofolate ligase [Myxococcales bacterium]
MTRPIGEVAATLGLEQHEWDGWGPGRAKVTLDAVDRGRVREGQGRLILVTAMTPTPAGEGKTTTSIGLVQGLSRIGENAVACLREPSLGPVFGAKGGGTGGGLSRLQPADAIDLHFTGDLHAITAANNLLAAMVDNNLYHRLEPQIDARRVVWRRVMDMNDRALRDVITGLGGNGAVREANVDITAASEIMAAFCLASGTEDLRARIGRIIVGFSSTGSPVTAEDLGATGAMMALLHDALRPNLAQTTEGVPAIIHGGPFANIAHGCSSILGTRLGLGRADWVVTEAGFAFDLGGEKFYDIKCRTAGLDTAAVVVVGTIRALRWHGGGDVDTPDPAAVARGLANLQKHVENVGVFGERPIVALNRRPTDTAEEIAVVRERFVGLGIPIAEADPYGSGGEGCTRLAELVVEHAERESIPYTPLYQLEQPVMEKVTAIATRIYGASSVVWTKRAKSDLARIKRLGLSNLPVCMAKTQSSLSDDASLRNRPEGFAVTVQDVRINAGAGFLVAILGDMLRMPGLPKRPNALDIDVQDGKIVGLRG